jgi:alpha-1,3-rhamnosyl/mannosyltransferase
MLALESPPPENRPFIITVHDVAGVTYDDEQPLPGWSSAAFSRARRILTPSHFSAEELVRHFGVDPGKLTVIGSGLGLPVSPSTPHLSDDQRLSLGISGPYVIRMGGYTRRKNVALLLDAWPTIRRSTGHSLVLTGAPIPGREEALRVAPGLDGVIVLDYVPADTIGSLLRSASLLVSTSLYEGVGLPPLEAMRAGVPVVAVRSAAAEETCGDAAVIVENDPSELAAHVSEVLADSQLQDALRSRGYAAVAGRDWHRTAAAVADAYRTALHLAS